MNLDEINIAFVRPRKATDRQQAYAQGHWMYEYIVETWGARAPLDLMDQYARGSSEESAFQSVLGVSREQFLRQFTPWARKQVESWGMVLPEGTPSVRDLLVRDVLRDPLRQSDVDRALRSAAAIGIDAWLGLVEDANATPDDAAGDGLVLPEPDRDRVNAWLVEFPSHPDVLELAARMALDNAGVRPEGESPMATPEIAPLLEQYAAARPVDPMPHRELARMYLSMTNLDAENARKAIPHLEYLDAREQRSPVYAMELARRYAALKDYENATAKAERATQITPFDADMRELAATINVQAGRLETAERHILALIELEPNQPVHERRLEAVRKKLGSSAAPK
jgi:hypothetical protein